jgi:serine/threonine protein kinase
MALLVAAVVQSASLALPTVMNVGLAFQIAGSYAIAAAEFADPRGLEMHRGQIGLSWVAVFVLLFTVVVPTSPRRAVFAALAAVSSVPVVIGLMMASSGITTFRLEPGEFFFGLVCLTGQSVFTSDTTIGLLQQHAQAPPTPPSARAELPIPSSLDDLVLSCLAKDPAIRPQSARELSGRLAEVKGASDWTQERARGWWTTHLALP